MTEIEPSDPELTCQARDLALNRLTVREYSAREMIAYLKRKGHSDKVARETVEALSQDKLIDDHRYARAVTRTQAIRDKGPGYILSKLRQKGVKIELSEVRTLYGESADHDELEMARRLVERRYPRACATNIEVRDNREIQRAYAALMRRGFSSEIARKVLLARIDED